MRRAVLPGIDKTFPLQIPIQDIILKEGSDSATNFSHIQGIHKECSFSCHLLHRIPAAGDDRDSHALCLQNGPSEALVQRGEQEDSPGSLYPAIQLEYLPLRQIMAVSISGDEIGEPFPVTIHQMS